MGSADSADEANVKDTRTTESSTTASNDSSPMTESTLVSTLESPLEQRATIAKLEEALLELDVITADQLARIGRCVRAEAEEALWNAAFDQLVTAYPSQWPTAEAKRPVPSLAFFLLSEEEQLRTLFADTPPHRSLPPLDSVKRFKAALTTSEGTEVGGPATAHSATPTAKYQEHLQALLDRRLKALSTKGKVVLRQADFPTPRPVFGGVPSTTSATSPWLSMAFKACHRPAEYPSLSTRELAKSLISSIDGIARMESFEGLSKTGVNGKRPTGFLEICEGDENFSIALKRLTRLSLSNGASTSLQGKCFGGLQTALWSSLAPIAVLSVTSIPPNEFVVKFSIAVVTEKKGWIPDDACLEPSLYFGVDGATVVSYPGVRVVFAKSGITKVDWSDAEQLRDAVKKWAAACGGETGAVAYTAWQSTSQTLDGVDFSAFDHLDIL